MPGRRCSRRRCWRWRRSARRPQDLKIGFVNSDRVLREAMPAKAAQAKLEAEFSQAREGAERHRQRAEGAPRDKLEQGRAHAVRGRAHAAPARPGRPGPRVPAQAPRVPGRPDQRKNEELAAVVERANRVIKQIAETEKYDLDPAGSGVRQPKIDITDKVIKALNAAGRRRQVP